MMLLLLINIMSCKLAGAGDYLSSSCYVVLHFVLLLQVARPTWLHLQSRRQQFVASYTDTEHHQNTRDIFDIFWSLLFGTNTFDVKPVPLDMGKIAAKNRKKTSPASRSKSLKKDHALGASLFRRADNQMSPVDTTILGGLFAEVKKSCSQPYMSIYCPKIQSRPYLPCDFADSEVV